MLIHRVATYHSQRSWYMWCISPSVSTVLCCYCQIIYYQLPKSQTHAPLVSCNKNILLRVTAAFGCQLKAAASVLILVQVGNWHGFESSPHKLKNHVPEWPGRLKQEESLYFFYIFIAQKTYHWQWMWNKGIHRRCALYHTWFNLKIFLKVNDDQGLKMLV